MGTIITSVRLKEYNNAERQLSPVTKASDIIFFDGIDLQTKWENGQLVDAASLSFVNAVSPTVRVIANTDTEYRIQIKSINGTITSPNLKGADSETVTAELLAMMERLEARVDELHTATELIDTVHDLSDRITELSTNTDFALEEQDVRLTALANAIAQKASVSSVNALGARIDETELVLENKADSHIVGDLITQVTTIGSALSAKANTTAVTALANRTGAVEQALTAKVDQSTYEADVERIDEALSQHDTRIEALENEDNASAADLAALAATVDTKLSSIFRYKGSVPTTADLSILGNTVGDTWNVEDTGANYAWNGTSWDKLSETIDLSPYLKISDYTSAAATNTARLDAIESGLLTKAEADSVYTRDDIDRFLSELDDEDTTYTAGDGIRISDTNEISVQNRTVREIRSANGNVALLFNESDGSGAKFTSPGNNSASFVGVNDGSGNIDVQIYAKDLDNNVGARINVNRSGAYYTVKENATFSDADEIITKKDLITSNNQNVTGITYDDGVLTIVHGDQSEAMIQLYASLSSEDIDHLF